MDILHRLEIWGDRHHPKWLDIIRIVLGVFLLFKGIDFLRHMSQLISILSKNMSFGDFAYFLIGHYVVFAHMIGGFLLIIGFLTRFACLIQIPVLLGAIIFISSNGDMLRPYSDLLLTVLVLLLLVYFLLIGNGPWSLKVTNREPTRL